MGSKFRKFIFPLRQLRLSFLNSFSVGPGSAVEEKGKKTINGVKYSGSLGRGKGDAAFPSPDFLSFFP